MDDDIHAVEGAPQALLIAHVADKIAQVGVVETRLAHLVLLQFVAAEDDHLGRLIFVQQDADEFLAKRAGSAGHQNNFIFPVHTLHSNQSNHQAAGCLRTTTSGYWPFSPQ